MDHQSELLLKIHVNEIDLIMGLLMDRPWKEVNNLIQKILQQANDPVLQSVVPGESQG